MKFTKLFLITLISLVVTQSCKKDDIVANVIGKVVDANNEAPVEGAKVIYNADEELTTDIDGQFRSTFNLGQYLADSISFFVTKEGYKQLSYSTVIGNTQKDIIVIHLEPK